MEKDHKLEETLKLFNEVMHILEFNKVSFKDWYNLNRAFEEIISENQLNTNYMLRYATVLYTSKVILLFDEEVEIFREKTKQLAKLIETKIVKKSKNKNYDDRKEIYQEVYLKNNNDTISKKQTKRK